MISGAQGARPSWFRRLVARAAARELEAFVVPGPEVARARGIDVEATGLEAVSTPRHASVLLVVGEIPEGLKKAATVAYAQMMRPRAVLAVGAGDVSPLPEPDVTVDLDQDALAGGVSELRRSFATGAFDPETKSFEAEEVQPEDEEGEEGGHDHGGHGHMGHGHMHHGSGDEEQDGSMEHGDHESQANDEQEDQDAEEDQHAGEESGPEDQSEMDHGDMDPIATVGMEQYMPVSGEDFMSMVEMTQGMPASGDGLVMEWFEAPYGPLFPGLPGGLTLTLTLDGDTVAESEVEPGIEGWEPAENWPGVVKGFAGRVARLDPLSPVAYRLLALRAVEDAMGAETDEQTTLTRVGALECERAASHLGWLASFGYLIGDRWLSRRAADLQLALIRAADPDEVERFETVVRKFARQIGRTPLLKSKLEGIGLLHEDAAAGASGPVARAGGVAKDVRTDEPVYRNLLGFQPVVREGNDALARLRVRLEEVERSLDLVREAGSTGDAGRLAGAAPSGTGTATVETPRGAATLKVTVEDGEVSAAELDTPSTKHLELVEGVMKGNEVADALVGVSSLDLSPWEMSR